MSVTPIDWAPMHQWPENTIYCRCGAIYRGHVKVVRDANSMRIHCEKPCPSCGQSVDNAVRVSSDPESWTIG